VDWQGDVDGAVLIIDQTLLPARREVLHITDTPKLIEAIASLRVRGAPAIGVAGAYGCVLALRAGLGDAGLESIARARPTAVNLRWAVERVRKAAGGDPGRALAEARAIHAEDEAACAAIGRHGAVLIKEGMGVLTHCNAGALATGGMGTALAPMYVAHQAGRKFRVFADETRPLLQGSRLTAFELREAGVDVTVIADNMAATVMQRGWVQLAITGADRIARNGDAANKIGTYGVALLARAHGVPLYIAAPRSTFDANTPDGAAIPIEERSADELRKIGETQTAPDGVKVFNPAFDVTPAELIAGYITEDGVIKATEIAGWLTAKGSADERR
jgi:methylthioribose-1-phosphate isomerase